MNNHFYYILREVSYNGEPSIVRSNAYGRYRNFRFEWREANVVYYKGRDTFLATQVYYLKNPSEYICIKAIKHNTFCFRLCYKQTFRMCLVACMKNVYEARHIKNTDKVSIRILKRISLWLCGLSDE